MPPARAAIVVLLVLMFAVASPAVAETTTVTIRDYTWDPLLGPPKEIPEELRTQFYPPGTPGLWLVQYHDDVINPSPWMEQTGLTGIESYGRFAQLWFGTPEQAEQARALAFVRCVDYWYPFEKYASSPRTAAPDVRVRVSLQLANVPGVERVLSEISTYCDLYADLGTGLFVSGSAIIRQANVPRLLRNAWVSMVAVDGLSAPDLVAVLPRSALPSNNVVISGGYFEPCRSNPFPFPYTYPCTAPPQVTFRDIPSPRVAVLDRFRLYAEVPPGLDAGPADIVVRLRDGSNQIFPAGTGYGFSVAPPGRITLARDDAVETEIVPTNDEYIDRRLRWSDPRGAPRMTIDLATTAVAFDGDGRLLVATYDGSAWYDAALQRMSAGPREAAGAYALLFDGRNNLIAVTGSSVVRLAPNGTLLGRIDGGGGDADLAADQCTLYLAGTPIRRLDVCTMTSLPPIAGSQAGKLRVLPDGGLLTVDDGRLRRYRRDGTLVTERKLERYGNALSISADATYARIDGATGRYDLATNEVTITADLYHSDWASSIASYGGWTAARGFAHYADGEIDELPQRRRVVASTPVSTSASTSATRRPSIRQPTTDN